MSTRIERRQSARVGLPDLHGIVRARLRPGSDVQLIDVSIGGALVETTHRLRPGAPIELQLVTQSEQTPMRGRVLRCAVARLRPSSIFYRGAIGFDRCLPWLLKPAGGEVSLDPGGELRPRYADRASGSHAITG